jgi:acyl transferase domain-containing protein
VDLPGAPGINAFWENLKSGVESDQPHLSGPV